MDNSSDKYYNNSSLLLGIKTKKFKSSLSILITLL